LWPPSWGECHEHSIALLDQVRQPHRLHPGGTDHYLQFVEACRGNGKTSAPFDYSGPLTESVLLGCLATRFPGTTLEWDAANLTFTNHTEANRFIRRQYRRRWEMEGL